MLGLDADKLSKVTQAAFDRAAGDKRWELAIARACRELGENPYMDWDGTTLLVLSPSGGLYEAGRRCQCASFRRGRPSWHRAAARLVRRYAEAQAGQ